MKKEISCAYMKLKDIAYEILINRLLRYCFPDEIYLKYLFKRRLGYKLNLKKPSTFNEKIQWIKLYDHNPLYTKYADKLAVRDYVKEKIGEEYLVPLHAVFDKPEEISFANLPEAFALKLNTGAGYNVICDNKANLDEEEIKKKFKAWMKEKFYQRYKEYHYKNIEKKILCEVLLIDKAHKELFDYKVYCFDGEPYLIMVQLGKAYNNHRNIYYTNWSRHDGWITFEQDELELDCPVCLNEMLECSRKLSSGFKEVRVDFYVVNDKLYFGEMTFTSGAGFSEFSSYEFDKELGDRVRL